MSVHVTIPTYEMYAGCIPGFLCGSFEQLTVTYSSEVRSGYPPHRHSHFEVFWVTGGEGEAIIESTHVSLRPMTLFFIHPGEVHHFSSTRNMSGVLMQFSPSFISTLDTVLSDPVSPCFWRPRSHPAIGLQPTEENAIKQIFANLWTDSNSPGAQREGFIKSHLLLLFNKARYFYSNRLPALAAPAEAEITQRFKAALREKCPPMVTVKQFADSLGISRSLLHRTVSCDTGRSPSTLIHERLILEAKRRLLNTNCGLTEISRQLGFGDASYFGRFFNRHAHVTPRNFRLHRTEVASH